MRYTDTAIVFREVPDEITLAINISGCKINCPGCHSPYLAEDVGEELTLDVLSGLISENPGITCVCLMGGDADLPYISQLVDWTKAHYPHLKTAWYSGREGIPAIPMLLESLDFIKTGPYIREKGPLTSRTTNQKFYRVDRNYEIVHGMKEFRYCFMDITNKFWKNESSGM